MRAIVAVAMLDAKRLWLAALGFGIACGILPSLIAVLARNPAGESAMTFGFLGGSMLATAAAAGVIFGQDFLDGKASFFYARPLSVPSMMTGRIVSVLALCVMALAGFTVSFVLTKGPARLGGILAQTTLQRLLLIAVVWTFTTYVSLTRAAITRQPARKTVWAVLEGLLRAVGVVALSALMLALFVDIMLRAMDRNTLPIKLLFGSYAVAMFIAIYVAIDRGRTDRIQIMRILTSGMYLHSILAVTVVIGSWIYILHPPPSAIQALHSGYSSPDGRVAYVAASVDRGTEFFQPFFSVDLNSGEVERLPMEYENNWRPWLWFSSDGNTKVWAVQTPLLFNMARRGTIGAGVFRYQTSFGDIKPLRLPDEIEFDTNFPATGPPQILPASGSDIVAVMWNLNGRTNDLAFVSPSRGELSRIDLASQHRYLTGWAFRPSGRLAAISILNTGKVRTTQLIEIDPATKNIAVVAELPADTNRARFNTAATQAVVFSGPPENKSIALVSLDNGQVVPLTQLSTDKEANLDQTFLADGRFAMIVRKPPMADLLVFSPDGRQEFRLPLGAGFTVFAGEPFPNTLTVSTSLTGKILLRFIDLSRGTIVREIEGFSRTGIPGFGLLADSYPPPGSPGSRMVLSKGKLFIIPSLSEEPRQLLPRP